MFWYTDVVNSKTASNTASTVIGYARVSTIGQTLEPQTPDCSSELISRVFYEPRIIRARNGFQLIKIAVRPIFATHGVAQS